MSGREGEGWSLEERGGCHQCEGRLDHHCTTAAALWCVLLECLTLTYVCCSIENLSMQHY